MGNLKKYMPITWITSLIGSLALIGTPFFSGFYSKDSIIEAVELSHIPGSGFAYFAVIVGVFVTAFYSFRLYFLVFHGEEKWRHAKHDAHAAHADNHDAHAHDDHDDHAHDDAHHHGLGPNDNPHEPGWVVTLPLALLAIPSLVIGYFALEPMVFGDFFKNVIFVNPEAHPAMEHLAHHYHEFMHSPAGMAIHGFASLPFILAASGVALSWFFYMKRPDIPAAIKARFIVIYNILENKYGFDSFNEKFFAGGSRYLGNLLWKFGDISLIDGAMVNGTANTMGKIAAKIRHLQSGLIYHYAFAMIIGVFLLMTFFIKIN